MPILSEDFPDVLIPPGGTALLKVPADVYKKVTCLKNGKKVKIWEETDIQAGQLYSFPIKQPLMLYFCDQIKKNG
jgi:hypothetical protein